MADKRISQLVDRGTVANNDVVPIVVSGASTTNKATISSIQTFMQGNLDMGVTSVGLSMPSAFVVSNSPVTASGNISVTGAGTVSQYIRGDGSLADFPSGGGGGGSSVNYYLNGSVSQGTIGGVAYQEMNRTPILGAGTDFTIAADGYIASFITDAGDPALLEIPAGNWNFETYLQASSGGGTPSFYIELYKVNSGGTATLIASNSGSPELIAFGTAINPYFSALAVPQTTLALTDRLALRYYVTHSGRTITLHTENSNLCQIITTFTTGLTALNGLTAQVQNLATGTSGTDFNIVSATSTHTFNLPTASATNRGLLSSADWTTFNNKAPSVAGGYVPYNGAAASVNLGVYSITANAINSAGSGSTAGQINLRSDAFFSLVNGYGSIASGTTNQFNFYQTTGAGVFRGAIFSLNSITPSATRTFTLPDADGTLALTSSLGSYLPLAGGTLTGALNGTSATFSTEVTSSGGQGRFGGWATGAGYQGNALEVGVSAGNAFMIGYNRTSGSYIPLSIGGTTNQTTTIGGSSIVFQNNGVTALTIASTGAATFSSSVTAAGGNSPTLGFQLTTTTGTSTPRITSDSVNATVIRTGASGSPVVINNFANSSELVRFTDAGNVGIGTASPVGKLDVNTGANRNIVISNDSTDTGYNIFSLNGTRTKGSYSGIAGGGTSDDKLYLNTPDAVVIQTGASFTERMRITSGGKLLVGTQTEGYGLFSSQRVTINPINDGIVVAPVIENKSAYTVQADGNSGTRYALYIANGSSTEVGYISFTSSSTSYSTSSDYRLKENVFPVEGALLKLEKLKPCNFNFKSNPEEQVMGFLAHEVQEIMPQAVTGEKDGFRIEEVEVSPAELDEEGNVITDAVVEEKEIPVYQGIDHSKLVPLLVAAIQELKTEIDSLKNQIK